MQGSQLIARRAGGRARTPGAPLRYNSDGPVPRPRNPYPLHFVAASLLAVFRRLMTATKAASRLTATIWLILLLRLTSTSHAASLADFTDVTAGHYQVLTQSGLPMASQVNGFMNEMLRHYSRYFSNWTFKDASRVVVFDNLADFHAYARGAIGATHPGLAGYCHLKTDASGDTFYELVTYEHDRLWPVLAHEGFHQFIGYELGDAVPVWLNEGLAQYFENSSVKGSRLIPGGLDPTRLAAAQALLRSRQMLAVPDLLTMERGTFYANPAITYPMSWALVHFLMNRDGLNYQSSHFRRYLQDLRWNRDELDSFRKRFGRESLEWEKEFRSYVAHLRALK